jgi:lipoprotein-anchoring transpeptidase ErfK/SrfK
MLRSRCTTLLLLGGLIAAASQGRAEPAATTAAIEATPVTATSGSVAPLVSTEILLDLSKREIALLREGKAVNRWPVVIGAPETPTPVGRFQVNTKVVNPVYQSTSTGQLKGVGPLGYRWIGFHNKGPNAFGIHGTPWPWWVDARAAVSHGCVRMRNEHIEKLFAAVEIGTPVIIQP